MGDLDLDPRCVEETDNAKKASGSTTSDANNDGSHEPAGRVLRILDHRRCGPEGSVEFLVERAPVWESPNGLWETEAFSTALCARADRDP